MSKNFDATQAPAAMRWATEKFARFIHQELLLKSLISF